MTLKSQVKFGRIGTVLGIVVIAGLLYYVITRKDAIVERAYGALDSRLSGAGAGGGGEAPPPEDAGTATQPGPPTGGYTGGAIKTPPTGALIRLIQYVRGQPAAPTPIAQRAATVASFQNAFPNLRARHSESGNRLIVTDRSGVQYATSTQGNQVQNFYNSIRNAPPTGTFGGPAQRAAAPANARRVFGQASQSSISNFRNALAAANARRRARQG